MLEDNYNHLEIEDKIYNFWESNKLFEPIKNNKKSFIIFFYHPHHKHIDLKITQ